MKIFRSLIVAAISLAVFSCAEKPEESHTGGNEYAVKIGWLNWGAQCRLAPMANLFSPKYRAEVEKRLRRYYAMIKEWYEALPANKKHLLVGVKCVGELALGVNNWYYPNGNSYYDRNPTANDAERLKIDPQTGINMYDKPSRGVQTIGYAAATFAGIKSALDIEGCRYVNICTNVIGNNNGTTVNSNAVQGVKSLCK